MTVLYVLMILLQAGVIIYFVRKGRMQRVKAAEIKVAPDSSTYEGLRNIAMHVTPDQLKLRIPDSETLVYGLIMDCNMGEGSITLSAYITGAVSMYFSTGGGKTGGGMNPEVAETAVDFVTAAQAFVNMAIKVAATDLPAKGCVRFYMLTNHGIYVAQELMTQFENGTSIWLPLFEKGNEVIGLMHNSGNGSAGH